MKRRGFFDNLKYEGKLELVEPSEDIYESYIEKSDNCLKSAKILLSNSLYENSVSMSYYAMYNALTALLFKIGIKCENHSGSILAFKKLFERYDLFKIISSAKKERIDTQYYLASKEDALGKKSVENLFSDAEKFSVQIKLIAKNLKTSDIDILHEKFNSILSVL
ncbi:MAG: HEPN domain-containing protein [Candidatus Aenigmarchaeota archaeon]|nr:HEPN domain-containing protein [Candidatus Aenigmarchaeota archaeon]MCK5334032.1 HEPN domain-containing protein [Candidatus Aenigmarchaeota archaeon]